MSSAYDPNLHAPAEGDLGPQQAVSADHVAYIALESGHYAFWSVDLVTGAFHCSAALTEVLRFPNQSLDGTIKLVLRRMDAGDRRELISQLREHLRGSTDAFNSRHKLKDASGRTVHVCIRGRRVSDTRLAGTVADITEFAEALEALRESEQRLSEARTVAAAHFKAAVEASFDAIMLLKSIGKGDRITDFQIAELNENAASLLKIERAKLLGKSLKRALPQFEREGTIDRYLNVAKTNVPSDQEFLTIAENGEHTWVHEQVVPIPDGIAVTRAGINDRKLAEQRLRESELFTHRITTSSPDWIFIYDLVLKRTTYANREPLSELGYTSTQIASFGQDGFFLLVHPEDTKDLDAIRSGNLGDEEVRELTYRLRSASGAYHWVSTRCVLFQRDSEGKPAQVLASSRDVTPQKLTEERLQLQMRSLHDAQIELQRRQNELETLNQRLATLATRDGLTGLHNHRSLQDRLSEEVSRADRTGRPVSLVMVDVDRFKNYNDRYGHPAGDVVLRELASVLANTARTTDFVARYGGEEFALLLPESLAVDAARLSERIREKLQEGSFAEEQVTASFGCAEYIPGMMTKADLIQEADRALYRAKRDGRDCVRVAGGLVEGEE